MKNAAADQTWDKGVSVREYFKTKLEPGEDEKALSQVISDVMTPTKTSGDVGVMDKVREAVSSLLRNEESSQYSVRSPTVRVSSSSHTPLLSATNVQQGIVIMIYVRSFVPVMSQINLSIHEFFLFGS